MRRTKILEAAAVFSASTLIAYFAVIFWPIGPSTKKQQYTPEAQALADRSYTPGVQVGGTSRDQVDNSTARSGIAAAERDVSIAKQLATGSFPPLSADVWIPESALQRLGNWNIGSFGMKYRMNQGLADIFRLDHSSQGKLEDTVNSMLDDIRSEEVKHVEHLENVGDSILLKVPANFYSRDAIDRYFERVSSVLGKDAASLFWKQLEQKSQDVTSAFSGRDRYIRVSLQGDEGIITQIDTMEMNYLPDYLNHLVQLVEDDRRK